MGWAMDFLEFMEQNATLIQTLAAIISTAGVLGIGLLARTIMRSLAKLTVKRQFNLQGAKIFISAPMSSSIQGNAELNVRLQKTVKELAEYFQETFKAKVFSSYITYFDRDQPNKFLLTPTEPVVKDVLNHLESSDAFVLIYPELLPSSVLVELGIALGTEKNCVVFYYRELGVEILPYMIRENSPLSRRYKVKHFYFSAVEDVVNIARRYGLKLFGA